MQPDIRESFPVVAEISVRSTVSTFRGRPLNHARGAGWRIFKQFHGMEVQIAGHLDGNDSLLLAPIRKVSSCIPRSGPENRTQLLPCISIQQAMLGYYVDAMIGLRSQTTTP
jgi:hypothetical protein